MSEQQFGESVLKRVMIHMDTLEAIDRSRWYSLNRVESMSEADMTGYPVMWMAPEKAELFLQTGSEFQPIILTQQLSDDNVLRLEREWFSRFVGIEPDPQPDVIVEKQE